ASVRLGTLWGISTIGRPRVFKRCATLTICHGSYLTSRSAKREHSSTRVFSIVASKSSGSSGDGWKIRCETSLTFFAATSYVQATIAVESCFAEASTPSHIDRCGSRSSGDKVGSTHASHKAISTNVVSLVTQRFSIIRRYWLGGRLCRDSSIHFSSHQGATCACVQNMSSPDCR